MDGFFTKKQDNKKVFLEQIQEQKRQLAEDKSKQEAAVVI
jgi:hypothetical protein